MDYLSLFEIGSIGMTVEKMRVDAISLNIANMNTASRVGDSFKPVGVDFEFRPLDQRSFEDILLNQNSFVRMTPQNVTPKLVYEPNNALANAQGYVEYPGVELVSESIAMIKAMHAYNANVKTVEAARVLAEEALSIGG